MINSAENQSVRQGTSSWQSRYLLFLVFAVLAIVLLVGTVLYYASVKKPASNRPRFAIEKQFVPRQAASLEVDRALATLGFATDLPFFERDNVVQSLNLFTSTSSLATSSSSLPQTNGKGKSFLVFGSGRASSSPNVTAMQSGPQVFLSYRIFGQDRDSIQKSFLDYFNNIGWQLGSTKESKSLMFFSHTGKTLFVNLIDLPSAKNTNEPTVVAAISMQ